MRTRIALLLIVPLAIIGCRAVGKPSIHTNTPDIGKIHPAAGTHLVRFQQLDDGVYKGSKPTTDADFQFLQAKGIRYLVTLRFFPFIHHAEKRKAKEYGMTLLTGTISASPATPSEKHINEILCLLRDKRYRPIYFHCDLGRDRAMLIAGLYEMYYKGKSKEDAWREMKAYGFKDDWTLAGLKKYFEKHSEQPVSRYVPHCPERALEAPGLHQEAGESQEIDLDALPDFIVACN
jgi:hypothetical protein